MLWINFLHFYQPANMEKEKIWEAAEKSYFFILRELENNPRIKFTANISGSLIIRLSEDRDLNPILEKFSSLFARGRLEITGTAAYHPLLPLIKKQIAKKEIKDQEKLLKKYLSCPKPKGFFLPEMAYSPQAGKLIKSLGYEWIILDEISAYGRTGALDTSKVYFDENSGLKVIFRSRNRSSGYVPKNIITNSRENCPPGAVITATDAELYGLKHKDRSGNFSKLLKKSYLKTTTISEFIESSGREAEPVPIKILCSSWDTGEEEMAGGRAFDLWSADDKIHNKLWALAGMAEKFYLKHERSEAAYWSYWHLVRGLSSCTFWWASGKDFKNHFGPRAWSPDEIEKGVNELVRSIRSLEKFTDLKTKLKAEKLALEIKKLVWEKHWKEYN